MKILALEFSSTQRSVAALTAGAAAEAMETDPRKTSGLEMIESVLRQAALEPRQVECLAVGLGPGSYTGIRAAIALAQGWQLARPVKLLGISSAECLAAQARQEKLFGRINVAIDAQRGEFYLAAWDVEEGGVREAEPLRLASLSEISERIRAGAVVIGPEAGSAFSGGRRVFPRAATLGKLALQRSDFIAGEKLEPIYLRETRFVKAPPPRVIG